MYCERKPCVQRDDGVNTGMSETQEERPPMDLFKAIFADDDCAGESSGEEDNRLADTQPSPYSVSGLLPTLPTSTSGEREGTIKFEKYNWNNALFFSCQQV